jgi:hypothetical protein
VMIRRWKLTMKPPLTRREVDYKLKPRLNRRVARPRQPVDTGCTPAVMPGLPRSPVLTGRRGKNNLHNVKNSIC